MNEALYRMIVEQAPDAMIVSDAQGAIVLWNRSAERIFGHSSAEVLGKSLDVIIPERLRAAHWTAFDKSLATGTTKYAGQVLTTRSMHKDGRTLYVDLAFALVKDGSGAVSAVLATARDCTAAYLEQKARAKK
jgi:PAS domain S-box-containing protein